MLEEPFGSDVGCLKVFAGGKRRQGLPHSPAHGGLKQKSSLKAANLPEPWVDLHGKHWSSSAELDSAYFMTNDISNSVNSQL